MVNKDSYEGFFAQVDKADQSINTNFHISSSAYKCLAAKGCQQKYHDIHSVANSALLLIGLANKLSLQHLFSLMCAKHCLLSNSPSHVKSTGELTRVGSETNDLCPSRADVLPLGD